MPDPKITVGKIAIFVLVIFFSFGLFYLITKTFASTCPDESVYDPSIKKCRVKCDDDSVYDYTAEKCFCKPGIYSTTCTCPSGQTKTAGVCNNCGTQGLQACGTQCIDPNQFVCINGNPCANYRVKDDGTCCQDDELWNGITKTCDKCDAGDICMGKCCSPDETCLPNGCCATDSVIKNPDGSYSCCMYEHTDTECCDVNQKVGPDGKCATVCGDNTTLCDADSQQCQDITINNLDGTSSTKSACRNTTNTCAFSQILWDPLDQGKTPVCQNTSPSGPGLYAYCHTSDISAYSKSGSATASDAIKNTTPYTGVCSAGDCYNLMENEGVEEVDWNETTGVCSAHINCSKGTGTRETCTGAVCPAQNKDQCCVDDQGNYTGTMCPTGVCYENQCYKGFAIEPRQQTTLALPGGSVTTGYVPGGQTSRVCQTVPIGSSSNAQFSNMNDCKKQELICPPGSQILGNFCAQLAPGYANGDLSCWPAPYEVDSGHSYCGYGWNCSGGNPTTTVPKGACSCNQIQGEGRMEWQICTNGGCAPCGYRNQSNNTLGTVDPGWCNIDDASATCNTIAPIR